MATEYNYNDFLNQILNRKISGFLAVQDLEIKKRKSESSFWICHTKSYLWMEILIAIYARETEIL